jgi:hypothetical protein
VYYVLSSVRCSENDTLETKVIMTVIVNVILPLGSVSIDPPRDSEHLISTCLTQPPYHILYGARFTTPSSPTEHMLTPAGRIALDAKFAAPSHSSLHSDCEVVRGVFRGTTKDSRGSVDRESPGGVDPTPPVLHTP